MLTLCTNLPLLLIHFHFELNDLTGLIDLPKAFTGPS